MSKQLEIDPIPVAIIKSPEELTSLAVEFGGGSQYIIPALSGNQPVQILTRRPTRDKARILVASLSATALSASSNSSTTIAGSVAAPASGTVIVSLSGLPAGLYQVTISAYIDGTVAAANDDDNITYQPVTNGASAKLLVNSNGSISTITYYIFLNGATSIIVRAGANNGTAGSVYHAQINAVPFPVGASNVGGATGLVLAHRPDYLSNPNNPQGFLVTSAPTQIEWENQQPCYAAGVGGAVTVSVLDQAQAASQAVAEESVEEIREEFQLEGQGGKGPEYQ